ncbi:hypothetical protein FACS189440_05590 [Bacteroidia bacterium]|nr:hypothetical protein FACS189423_01500 [Bacteroidia bacterium]GHT46790.1 hypothetical protein FACS189440_05590 [Bacteroidia bacterium]
MYNKIQDTQQKKNAYSDIPAFQLPDIDGNVITESSLQKNKSTLFLFFNPDCELCREEIKQIKTNQEAFKSFQIVFFTDLPAESIKFFLTEITFEPSFNMFFLIDEKEKLITKMEVKGTPESYIYNQNGKLIKRFNGPVKIETLIKYLSE